MAKKSKYAEKEQWVLFEEDVAEYLDGKRQPGSGNGPVHKGDIKSDEYLVECKYTSKEFYRLNVKTWAKIMNEAMNADKIPLFACRSQAGDFFIGSTLDFDCGTDNMLEPSNHVDVKDEFFVTLKGDMCDFSLVCWKVDLEDC